jgi:hypothetical protein
MCASATIANRDFKLIRVVRRPSAATSDPDGARDHAVIADRRKQLAEDKKTKRVEGYNDMQTFFGQQDFRQITCQSPFAPPRLGGEGGRAAEAGLGRCASCGLAGDRCLSARV